jgi:5'-nucleotidase
MRRWRFVLAACALVVTSACTFSQQALRYSAAPGTVSEPFWCAPQSGTALSVADCERVSAQLDLATFFAYTHFHASDALAAGAKGSAYQAGVGAAFEFRGPSATFDATHPDTLLYDGTAPKAQVAGLEWNVVSTSAPAGFAGDNDTWTNEGNGVWRLRAWGLRPFQNQVSVFAATHPCLATSGPIYDITNACYTTTHPRPAEVLVSNDDGFNAPGIDTAVEALRALPALHVTVSAPATNQSGAGAKTTPGGVSATLQHTLHNYPAWAVNGFPADSVLYALGTLHLNPDLVVAGINNGQNIGPLINISGTVGAARVGGTHAIPSVAVSQGLGSPPDFPSGANALISWVTRFLLGRVGPSQFQTVVNINVPTCTSGSIRGTVVVPTATDAMGRPFNPSNCTSTVTNFADDMDAFLNGFISESSIGNG